MMLLRRITCRGQRSCGFPGRGERAPRAAQCHGGGGAAGSRPRRGPQPRECDSQERAFVILHSHLDGLLRGQLAASVGVDGGAGVALPPQRLAAVIDLVRGEVDQQGLRAAVLLAVVLKRGQQLAGDVDGTAGGGAGEAEGGGGSAAGPRARARLAARKASRGQGRGRGLALKASEPTRLVRSGSRSQATGWLIAAQLSTASRGPSAWKHSSRPSPVARSTQNPRTSPWKEGWAVELCVNPTRQPWAASPVMRNWPR